MDIFLDNDILVTSCSCNDLSGKKAILRLLDRRVLKKNANGKRQKTWTWTPHKVVIWGFCARKFPMTKIPIKCLRVEGRARLCATYQAHFYRFYAKNTSPGWMGDYLQRFWMVVDDGNGKDCGWKQLAAISSDVSAWHQYCCDLSQQYWFDFRRWERPLHRRAIPGDLFNILDKVPTIAGGLCLDRSQPLPSHLTIPAMTSIWRTPVSGDRRRRPSVAKLCVTSPEIAGCCRTKLHV